MFLGLGIENGEPDWFPCLSIEHIVVISILQDLLSIDFLDDTASRDTSFLLGQRAPFDDLFDLQAIALIVVVKKYA